MSLLWQIFSGPVELVNMESAIASAGVGMGEQGDLDSRGTGYPGCMPPRRWREVELGSTVRPGERSGASLVVYREALYVFGGYGGRVAAMGFFAFCESRGFLGGRGQRPNC